MARGKHSRALFEVIKQTQEQQAKRASTPQRAAVGGLFGWLKRTPSTQSVATKRRRVEPVMREVDEHPAVENPSAIEAVDSEIVTTAAVDSNTDSRAEETDYSDRANSYSSNNLEDTSESMAVHVFAPDRDEPTVEQERVALDESIESSAEPVSSHDTAISAAITDKNETPPVRYQATTDTRSVSFSLNYPSLGIAAVAFGLLLTVAFMAGRKSAPRVSLTGPTLEQLQQGKSSPDVLNLKNTPPEATLSRGAETKPPAPQRVEPVADDAAANTPATPDRRRIGGRNYIIAQSYPDPDNAEKAAALLQKNNIPVTVEQLDAAPGWYCVVTEVGFDRVSSPDCDRYQKLIKDINPQTKAARLKDFQPYLYKWK